MNLEERFWAKVDKRGPDECWPWLAARDRDGYGRFHPMSKTLTHAQRMAFTLAVGVVAPGMYVCHTCDNPPCCNPSHLFAGSPSDAIALR